MITATSSDERERGERSGVATRRRRPAAATTAVFSPSGLATPSAAGTCWRKMIIAIPTVKPSITGQGMYARKRPSRANGGDHDQHPGDQPTTNTASTP